MNRATSVYLDALRAIAALVVFFSHSLDVCFYSPFSGVATCGYEFVMVFFVLSGFVIAHATLSRPQGVSEYAVARLSRLYSVVLPAIVLTEILRLGGTQLAPEFYSGFDRGHHLLRALMSTFYLNEFWGFSSAPPTNGPMWSLSYEFVYYVLFAIALFVRDRCLRYAGLLLAALFVGPKILLLLPVWLMGVGSYLLVSRRQFPRMLSRWFFVISVVGFVALLYLRWRLPKSGYGNPPLFFSGPYLSDYVIGLLVAVAIVSFSQISRRWGVPGWLEKPVRISADCSFSLYLFHYPLLCFGAAMLGTANQKLGVYALQCIGILLVVVLFSRLTEAKRPLLRRALAGIASKLVPRIRPRWGSAFRRHEPKPAVVTT